MIPQSFNLFFLRELPFSNFAFSRRQSVLAMTLIGVLAGLDPSMRTGTLAIPGMPLFVSIPIAVLAVWAAFLPTVGILKWWMRRGNRWDGHGDMLNLIAASWLIADTLGAGLIALGAPSILALPLWFYSVWVGGNALSGAIPKASLNYAIGGIVVSLIPALIGSGLAMGLASFVLSVMSVTPGAVAG